MTLPQFPVSPKTQWPQPPLLRHQMCLLLPRSPHRQVQMLLQYFPQPILRFRIEVRQLADLVEKVALNIHGLITYFQGRLREEIPPVGPMRDSSTVLQREWFGPFPRHRRALKEVTSGEAGAIFQRGPRRFLLRKKPHPRSLQLRQYLRLLSHLLEADRRSLMRLL